MCTELELELCTDQVYLCQNDNGFYLTVCSPGDFVDNTKENGVFDTQNCLSSYYLKHLKQHIQTFATVCN